MRELAKQPKDRKVIPDPIDDRELLRSLLFILIHAFAYFIRFFVINMKMSSLRSITWRE